MTNELVVKGSSPSVNPHKTCNSHRGLLSSAIEGVTGSRLWKGCVERLFGPTCMGENHGVSLSHKLDPHVFENALRILSLSAEEAKDPLIVSQKHKELVDTLASRRQNLPPLLADQLGSLIADANTAYETLRLKNVSKPSSEM